MRRALRALLLAVLALFGGLAAAHEMSMAEMRIRETAPGEFVWQWTAVDERQAGRVLAPVWPPPCAAEAQTLRCGAQGLSGPLSMQGIGKLYSAAIVKIEWRDGQTTVHTLTSSQPRVQLFGSADDRRGWQDIASAYTLLGIEHILTGLDHLLFVVGLLFLVGFNRRLVWTVTAFTAAHSLTLGLSAGGWLTLRPPPVEAAIALSIMLVAGEAMRRRATLARRWPALVAFLFGLVHGLGFAGALKEIGLPANHFAVALLTFNLGVEIGQLLTVAAAWVLWRVLARLPRLQQARTGALYTMGAVAAYWSWLRIWPIVMASVR